MEFDTEWSKSKLDLNSKVCYPKQPRITSLTIDLVLQQEEREDQMQYNKIISHVGKRGRQATNSINLSMLSQTISTSQLNVLYLHATALTTA
ncbi:hypothetical protein PoB_005352800 [Plakobranchus ocellatus]|uniref:Uncharacterized protein n=1 Tax=Plakobranchus ocellatus TaxID=259542 RepID=A0AAV4C555_9GAST|nr:hypothetical protein PoB_005352800 [Plakobranchus ocellatus]